MCLLISHMVLHKNCYNNLRPKIRVSFVPSSESSSATNQKPISYVKTCFVYVFSLDEWNWSSYSFLTCFSSRFVSFSAALTLFNYCFRLVYTRVNSVTLLICENKNNVKKPFCLGHFYFLVEKFLLHCSCTIISPSSESF